MSATVHATGLAAGHGARSLFHGLDLVVAPGDVIGLVGANGAGKSTLLRMLAGLEPPERGRVTVTPPGATVGFLPQEAERRPGRDRARLLRAVAPASRWRTSAGGRVQGAGPGPARRGDAYATALDRWLALGGADLDERPKPWPPTSASAWTSTPR